MSAVKQKRTKRLNVNVTEDELKKFKALAESKGVPLSTYIRLLLSEKIK